jgi:hypothetical protein
MRSLKAKAISREFGKRHAAVKMQWVKALSGTTPGENGASEVL